MPTPSAARGITPREEINAVSTKAVIGSAVRDRRTGIDNPSRVRWGREVKGWGEVIGFVVFLIYD
jgi:hypothetical protein